MARWKNLPDRLVHVILGQILEGREETLQRLPPSEKLKVLLYGVDASEKEQLTYMETGEGRDLAALVLLAGDDLEYIASLAKHPRKAHAVAGDRVRKGPTCCFRAPPGRIHGATAGDSRLGPRGRVEK